MYRIDADDFPRTAIGSPHSFYEDDTSASVQPEARASRIACQMCSLVAGMWRSFTPSGASASTTALTIAGSAPTVPASPAPLAPSGLRLVGTGFEVISMYGIASARGRQ